MQTWQEANQWEANWWGSCLSTYYEEFKQEVYARLMGLDYSLRYINITHASVLDIGGGPVSLLLKSINKGYSVVVDPLPVPTWVKLRYRDNHIQHYQEKAEEFSLWGHKTFDEVWIYNCLQHTDNPKKIITQAHKNSKLIRLFEWVEEPISDGHIHTLHEQELNTWLKGKGKVSQINKQGAHGLAYFGIFKGKHYED